MSPEQVRGEAIDARSDIFSLGTILYEMLSGHQPFRAGSPVETMHAILSADPPPLDINPQVQRVVRHCLEKNRELRVHSARDVAYELQTVSSFHEPVKNRRTLWIVVAAAAIVVIVAAALWRLWPHPAAQPIDSLAVLPFVNVAQLPQIKVMSHSTMFKFKGKDIDPQEVGRQLHVRAVVAGRVSELADHLMIQAELVDVADGSQLWGEQYNRSLSDIFAIEEEIARDISQKLRLRLTGRQEQRLTKRYTADVQAYELYLKGRQFWNRRTPADLQTAASYFQQAIDRDPNYALAYAGLADSYALYSEYVDVPAPEAQEKAKAAATKALEIDPELGEAQATLGVLADNDWRWADAEEHLRRAIALNPNYATAYQWYALHLATLRRMKEAVAMIDRAPQLDPLSAVIQLNVAIANCVAGDRQRAMSTFREGLQMNPNYAGMYLYYGRCLSLEGRRAEALQQLIKANQLYGRPFNDGQAALAYGLAVNGQSGKAEAIARDLASRYTAGHCPPYYVAMAYAGFNEPEAIRWLQRAVAEHDPNARFVSFMPEFEHVRHNPSVIELLRRMGLPAA